MRVWKETLKFDMHNRIRLINKPALLTLLFLGLCFIPSRGVARDGNINERCISCHKNSYEVANKARFKHIPFSQRRCATCHLREETDLHSENLTASTQFSGSLVSQEPLWTRQYIYPNITETIHLDHSIGLMVPEDDKYYRFRIILSETAARTGKKAMTSRWFGLYPKEISTSGEDLKLKSISRSSVFSSEILGPPVLSPRAETHINLSWQTKAPMFSWIEVQALDGISLAQVTSGSENTGRVLGATQNKLHDLLRPPEELTIEVCYTCHPRNSIGSSHPVRLYAGENDTVIPKQLPTIGGMLTCVTCHNPHGSQGKQLVREEIVTKLCVTCHYQFKGKSQSTLFN